MTQTAVKPSSIATVEQFLTSLARADVDTALALVTEDLVYTNVSLPTLHGRARLGRLARPLIGRGRMVFDFRMHHIAADGDVVLTDRTDEMSFGRLHLRFWVCGRFVVRDGQIAVWRDSFDWLDMTVATVRGLAGVIVPAAARTMPA